MNDNPVLRRAFLWGAFAVGALAALPVPLTIPALAVENGPVAQKTPIIGSRNVTGQDLQAPSPKCTFLQLSTQPV
ncbi:MAG: hypothetical protein K2H64_11030 [Desulfovibrio sp.]|nr:hypothetical protein [Desulfovibrio sp.]